MDIKSPFPGASLVYLSPLWPINPNRRRGIAAVACRCTRSGFPSMQATAVLQHAKCQSGHWKRAWGVMKGTGAAITTMACRDCVLETDPLSRQLWRLKGMEGALKLPFVHRFLLPTVQRLLISLCCTCQCVFSCVFFSPVFFPVQINTDCNKN